MKYMVSLRSKINRRPLGFPDCIHRGRVISVASEEMLWEPSSQLAKSLEACWKHLALPVQFPCNAKPMRTHFEIS